MDKKERNEVPIHKLCEVVVREDETAEIGGVLVTGLKKPGCNYLFEYRCWEDHDSADAELWYRSHSDIEVISLGGNCDGDDDPIAYATPEERADAGHSVTYRIRFSDGYEATAFEDEILSDKSEFVRPNPPTRRSN